jgi:hypothetical protein
VPTNNLWDTTNRNQLLLYFHTDLANNIVWTRKSFLGYGVKPGLKIRDRSKLFAPFPWPPIALEGHNKITINHFFFK